MTILFAYLVKVNVALLLFYALYRIVLRPLTFYQLNRFYLLGGMLIASVLPFLHFAGQQQQPELYQQIAIANWEIMQPKTEQHQNAGIGWQQWVAYVYYTGAVFMLMAFLIKLISLYRLHQNSYRTYMQNVRHVPVSTEPFSFGKFIYLNTGNHSSAQIEHIVEHELVHCKQKHSVDIILAELNKIAYWFNPGVWLYATAIKENLEFIADQKMLTNGVNARQYQYQLLHVATGVSCKNELAAYFAFINLKKRIAMMNKKRSPQWSKLKYVLALPLIFAVAMLVAQSTKTKVQKAEYTNGPAVSNITQQAAAQSNLIQPASNRSIEKENPAGVSGIQDTVPVYRIGSNSSMTGETNTSIDGKSYRILIENSLITEMYVDGEKISAEKIISYKPFLDKLYAQFIKNQKQSKLDAEQSRRDAEQSRKDAKQSILDAEQSRRDAEKSARVWNQIFIELINDKIINNRKDVYSFQLNNKELKINAVVQPSNIHKKYKEKYWINEIDTITLVYEISR